MDEIGNKDLKEFKPAISDESLLLLKNNMYQQKNRKIFVFYGGRRSGKKTFIMILEKFFPGKMGTVDSSDLHKLRRMKIDTNLADKIRDINILFVPKFNRDEFTEDVIGVLTANDVMTVSNRRIVTEKLVPKFYTIMVTSDPIPIKGNMKKKITQIEFPYKYVEDPIEPFERKELPLDYILNNIKKEDLGGIFRDMKKGERP
jgi:hypothetical protein